MNDTLVRHAGGRAVRTIRWRRGSAPVSLRIILAAVTVCLAGGGSPAGAQGDLEQRLKARYEGNLVVLRGFPTGTRLRYDETGTPIGSPAPGIWTVDGRVQIDRLQLRGGTLRLDASRVAVFYVPERREFDHGRMPGRSVRLDIAVGQPATEDDVQRLLERVFLTSQDDLAALVPAHWQRFLREYRNPDWPSRPARHAAPSARPLTPPQRTRYVQPRFPREAEIFTQSGVVVLDGTVTVEGRVVDLEVIQPTGFGFEEAAIEAVSQWRFTPVIVNGVPQDAGLTVTVRFTKE